MGLEAVFGEIAEGVFVRIADGIAGITEIESIDLTISEVGGEELARRRIRSGAVSAGLNPIVANPRPQNTQRGRFATAPSIREQIEQSDRRMRLQMQVLPPEKKKRTLLDFMVKKAS
jgi:hypothetical protein